MDLEVLKPFTFGYDPRLIVSVVFVAVSASILLMQIFPQFRLLLKYGKTAQQKQVTPDTALAKLVERVLAFKVPKSWFLHYYVFYLMLQWSQAVYIFQNPTISKYTVIWALLTFQATRRMIESYTLTKWSSKLQMHITHYFAGLLYYLGVSSNCFLGLLEQGDPIQWNWKYYLLITTFIVFSVDQFNNHRHLASLVKYSVPTYNFFKLVACAHYFDEVVIYLVVILLSFVQKPYTVPDWNFIGSWIFVITNLSVSAQGTKTYYQEKFDNYDIKYAIIPYIL